MGDMPSSGDGHRATIWAPMQWNLQRGHPAHPWMAVLVLTAAFAACSPQRAPEASSPDAGAPVVQLGDGGADAGLAPIGGACRSSADCAPVAGVADCLTEAEATAAGTTAPGGYCTSESCNQQQPSASCGLATICGHILSPSEWACEAACATAVDCRSGFTCVGGGCAPTGVGPVVPDTSPDGPITFLRAPWGNTVGGTPFFVVMGAVGAASGAVSVEAFDGEQPGTATRLAEGSVNADGSFELVLPGDASTLFLAGKSASDERSATARVHNLAWLGTFGGKISGSTATNPHVLTVAPTFDVAELDGRFLGPLHPDASSANEAASYTGLVAGGDSLLLTTASQSRWIRRNVHSSLPGLRQGAMLTYDGARGVTVLFGGCSQRSNGLCTRMESDTWELGPDGWTSITPAGTRPSARAYGAMTWDAARGVTLLYGGCTSTNANGLCATAVDDTWSWDGVRWTALAPGTKPPKKTDAAMTYDAAAGRVLLFGGCSGDNSLPDCNHTADFWSWDGLDWAPLNPSGIKPSARADAAMTYDSRRHLMILQGGHSATAQALRETWFWDGAAWSHPTGSDGPAVSAQALAYDPMRDRAVLFGGTNTNETWEWNGSTWSNVTPATGLPPARSWGQAVYDAQRGRISMSLGNSTPQLLNDTWLWDGAAWTNATPSNAIPPARALSAMSYDPQRHVSTMFSGGRGPYAASGGYLNDTWEWNGAAWAGFSASAQPVARAATTMAFDEAHGVTVAFGGYSPNAFLSDTQTWDGSHWSDVSPAGATPTARYYANLVYDSALSTTWLFGGWDGVHARSDLWQWDGGTWTDATPTGTSPPGRYSAGAAFDTARSVMWLFGGDTLGNGNGFLNDIWAWNGTAWSQRLPAGTLPRAREEGLFIYDRARGVSVLFGGVFGAVTDLLNDTWEWDGSSWTRTATEGDLPAPRYSVAAAYDSARQRIVIATGIPASNDTWEYPSALQRRVAAIGRFTLASSGIPLSSIQKISVSASAGATGHTLDALNPATAPGATLAIWDHRAGAWKRLATNTAAADQPAAIEAMVNSEARRFIGADESLHVALFPTQGRGAGAKQAQLVVDEFNVRVLYQQ